MTREATLKLLDHLCNEARNAMHTTFGLIESEPDRAADPVWQNCLDASRTSADRLLRTIDDLREIAGGEPADGGTTEEFDVTKSVREIAVLLNLGSADHSDQLTVQSFEEPLRIHQDRRAFEEVLARILSLIVKLSPEAEVRVAAEADEPDRVCLGIVPSNPEAAWQLIRWFNADVEQLQFSDGDISTAIAAVVAGRRLRAIGGWMECLDDAAPGIALYLTNRVVEAQDTADTSEMGTQLQVLVAEDCDESYALTELLLRSESVDRARSGIEAIDKVKRRRYDMVFMDVHMPGPDGYETIRAIREWETEYGNARTPIVVLSSDDIATQKRSAAQSGCSGFLRKPVRQSDLAELLLPLRAARDLLGVHKAWCT
jgi:CheY-like chemotaxis protein